MGRMNKFINNASPSSKMFMAIAVTTALVVSQKYFYAPYVKRQRYRQAESWADSIIEQEERERGGASQYEQH